jgi:hypothetical protein
MAAAVATPAASVAAVAKRAGNMNQTTGSALAGPVRFSARGWSSGPHPDEFVRATRQEGTVKLFAKGNRVTQATYGTGTITSSDERYTVIEFDNHGRRVFITDMVTLGQTDEPAPKKKKAAAKRTKKVAAAEAATE